MVIPCNALAKVPDLAVRLVAWFRWNNLFSSDSVTMSPLSLGLLAMMTIDPRLVWDVDPIVPSIRWQVILRLLKRANRLCRRTLLVVIPTSRWSGVIVESSRRLVVGVFGDGFSAEVRHLSYVLCRLLAKSWSLVALACCCKDVTVALAVPRKQVVFCMDLGPPVSVPTKLVTQLMQPRIRCVGRSIG